MQMRHTRLHNTCHCLPDLLLPNLAHLINEKLAGCLATEDAEHPGGMDKGPASMPESAGSPCTAHACLSLRSGTLQYNQQLRRAAHAAQHMGARCARMKSTSHQMYAGLPKSGLGARSQNKALHHRPPSCTHSTRLGCVTHCKYAMKCIKRDPKCLSMLDLLRDWDALLPTRQKTKIGRGFLTLKN